MTHWPWLIDNWYWIYATIVGYLTFLWIMTKREGQ